jgi:hypothetical protein
MFRDTFFDVPTDLLSHQAIYRTLIYVVLIATCDRTVMELIDCARCLLMKVFVVSFTASVKLRNLSAVKLHNQPSSLALY